MIISVKTYIMIYNYGYGTKRRARKFSTIGAFNDFAFRTKGIIIHAQWVLLENIKQEEFSNVVTINK